jgi:hypothetical protein
MEYHPYNEVDNAIAFSFLDKTTNDKVNLIIDKDDLHLILNIGKIFKFNINENKYPYYVYNKNQINFIECIYGMKSTGLIYNFKNKNEYDLRKFNIEIYHVKHNDVLNKYRDAIYLGGHINNNGKYANIIKNPTWKITLDNRTKYIMYCEPDSFCILCDESLEKILKFEKENNIYPNKLTWTSNNNYISCHMKNNVNNNNLYIHQIIMNHYGNGRGTKNTSIDHIDRNTLNNSMDNLRIATRKEQEQNTRGIIPGTKRERQSIARALPEGIEHHMLRKYVVYYLNTYNKEKGKTREYFRVEHPLLPTPWESSKSEKVSIREKLETANKVADDLEKGIFPEKKEHILPKYFTIYSRNGKNSLVFDRRHNGKRLNYTLPIEEDEPTEEKIKELLDTIKKQIIDKYESAVYE